MKNLLAAIEMLSALPGEVLFDIYGPVDDQAYFLRCRQAAAKLPANVKVCFKGPLPHEEAQAKFSEYHFFLFPTLGENFGHVIVEALAAGCPVITSTETPWSGLQQRGAGWDLPLSDRNAWREALQHCVAMKDDEYQSMSKAAAKFVRDWLDSSPIKEANVALFNRSLSGSARNDEPEQGTDKDLPDQSSKVLSC